MSRLNKIEAFHEDMVRNIDKETGQVINYTKYDDAALHLADHGHIGWMIETLKKQASELKKYKRQNQCYRNAFKKGLTVNKSVRKVEEWARQRNLDIADPHKQILKVVEEIGEISGALARDNMNELKVEIGDGVVTLIILAMQLDMDMLDCLDLAYEKIKNRKGKTVNGIYIKEADLYIKPEVST